MQAGAERHPLGITGPAPVTDLDATSETPLPRPSATAADSDRSASAEEAVQRVRDTVADLVAYKLLHRLQPLIDTFVGQIDDLLDELIDQFLPDGPQADAGSPAQTDGCAARGTTAWHNACQIDGEVPRGYRAALRQSVRGSCY